MFKNYDDNFFEHVFDTCDEEHKNMIIEIATENQWTIGKATRFIALMGYNSEVAEFEKKENKLN